MSFTQNYLTYRNPLVPAEIELAHSPSVWYRLARQFRPPHLPKDEAFCVFSVVGANMSMHQQRALEVGGFDESLIFGEGEEASLCGAVRARFGELSVIVDPRIVMAHRFDVSMKETWRRSYAYGQGAGKRWRKQGGWPSLPAVGPAAVIVALLIAPFSWSVGLVAGLAAAATPWAFWMKRNGPNGHAVALVYPLAALVEDLVSVFGFARGVSRESGGSSRVRRR